MVKLRRNHEKSNRTSLIRMIVYLLIALGLIAAIFVTLHELTQMTGE